MGSHAQEDQPARPARDVAVQRRLHLLRPGTKPRRRAARTRTTAMRSTHSAVTLAFNSTTSYVLASSCAPARRVLRRRRARAGQLAGSTPIRVLRLAAVLVALVDRHPPLGLDHRAEELEHPQRGAHVAYAEDLAARRVESHALKQGLYKIARERIENEHSKAGTSSLAVGSPLTKRRNNDLSILSHKTWLRLGQRRDDRTDRRRRA